MPAGSPATATQVATPRWIGVASGSAITSAASCSVQSSNAASIAAFSRAGLRAEVVADAGQVRARLGDQVARGDVRVAALFEQPPRGGQQLFAMPHGFAA